jgi:hypothetical protein
MESWFSTVKSEACERFESYAHAKEALFDYIEVFYNQRRRHSTLGRSVRRNLKSARHGAWIPWKTAKNAVSHRLHTHHLSLPETTKERKAINLRQPSVESDTPSCCSASMSC